MASPRDGTFTFAKSVTSSTLLSDNYVIEIKFVLCFQDRFFSSSCSVVIVVVTKLICQFVLNFCYTKRFLFEYFILIEYILNTYRDALSHK